MNVADKRDKLIRAAMDGREIEVTMRVRMRVTAFHDADGTIDVDLHPNDIAPTRDVALNMDEIQEILD